MKAKKEISKSTGGSTDGLIREGKYLPIFSSVTMGIPRDDDLDMDDYIDSPQAARDEEN